MKIALVCDSVLPTLGYGGSERVVMSLARELRNQGHEVFLLSQSKNKIEDFETGTIPETHTSDMSRHLPRDVDFIHFHQPISIEPKKPHLVTIHGNAQPGEVFFPNTSFVSRSHAKNHNSNCFVYSSIDPGLYPFREEKEDYFVFMALTKRWAKNIHTSVQWANELGVRLEVIGGNGPTTENIRYHGIMTDSQGRLELLSKAKALVYPTNWQEPCAIAPLEALACGTPVIGTYNGAMPEVIDSRTGVLCHDYEEFLAAPSKLENIRPIDCRSLIETKFSAKQLAKGYLNLYRQIMEEGRLKQNPRYAFAPGITEFLLKPSVRNSLAVSYRNVTLQIRRALKEGAA